MTTSDTVTANDDFDTAPEPGQHCEACNQPVLWLSLSDDLSYRCPLCEPDVQYFQYVPQTAARTGAPDATGSEDGR